MAGNWLLEGIQDGVPPCDDFYKFACGKYVTNNPPPDTTIYRRNTEGIPFNYLTNEGLGKSTICILHSIRISNTPIGIII